MPTADEMTLMIARLLSDAFVDGHVESIRTLDSTTRGQPTRTTYVLTKSAAGKEAVLAVLRDSKGIGTVMPGHRHVYVSNPLI